MAVIKLVDTEWLNQEAERVEGSLLQWLGGSDGRAGRDATELKARLEYVGLYYTAVDLVAIRDKLIADGVIEIV